MEISKKPKKVGRPKKWDKIKPDEVYELARQGLGVMDVCRGLNNGKGVGWDTFNRARAKNSDISDAYERGLSESVKFVNGKLLDTINEGSIQAIQFFLRNKRPDEWNKDQRQQTDIRISLSDVLQDAKQRINNSSATINIIDVKPQEQKGEEHEVAFSHRNDSEKEIKNNGSGSLSPSKTKTES
jgi:hypothetical protein